MVKETIVNAKVLLTSQNKYEIKAERDKGNEIP